jgi:hypothetical protein
MQGDQTTWQIIVFFYGKFVRKGEAAGDSSELIFLREVANQACNLISKGLVDEELIKHVKFIKFCNEPTNNSTTALTPARSRRLCKWKA